MMTDDNSLVLSGVKSAVDALKGSSRPRDFFGHLYLTHCCFIVNYYMSISSAPAIYTQLMYALYCIRSLLML